MARLRSGLDSRLSSRSCSCASGAVWTHLFHQTTGTHDGYSQRYRGSLSHRRTPCSVSEPLSRPRSVPDSYRRRRGRHAAMTVSTGIRKAPWHVFLSAASHHQRPRLKYLGLLGLHPGPKADESASDTPWSPTPTPAREWRRHGSARRGRKPKKKRLGQPESDVHQNRTVDDGNGFCLVVQTVRRRLRCCHSSST